MNFLKSSATLIRYDADDVTHIIDTLGCPIVNLPITYLGIPLTVKRPSAACFNLWSTKPWACYLPGKRAS